MQSREISSGTSLGIVPPVSTSLNIICLNTSLYSHIIPRCISCTVTNTKCFHKPLNKSKSLIRNTPKVMHSSYTDQKKISVQRYQAFLWKKWTCKFYIWMCSHTKNTNTGNLYHFSTTFCAGANWGLSCQLRFYSLMKDWQNLFS